MNVGSYVFSTAWKEKSYFLTFLLECLYTLIVLKLLIMKLENSFVYHLPFIFYAYKREFLYEMKFLILSVSYTRSFDFFTILNYFSFLF